MDKIFVNNLVFAGLHGHYSREKKDRQLFRVDVTCDFDSSDVISSDKIADTVDYRRIRQLVQEHIEGQSFNMIETLANTIASKVLEDKRVLSVQLSLQKMGIWGNGVPGVIITRPINVKKEAV